MTQDEMIPGLDAILSSMDRGMAPEDRRKMLRYGLQLLGILPKSESAASIALGVLGNGEWHDPDELERLLALRGVRIVFDAPARS
jgi:hypothetical protein